MTMRSTPAQIPPLRAVREAHGLSLREVAGRARIDPGWLSKVERGDGGLSVDALHRLALVLGLERLAKMLEPYVRDAA